MILLKLPTILIEPPGAVTRYAGFHRLLISLLTIKNDIIARNMIYVGKDALQNSLQESILQIQICDI